MHNSLLRGFGGGAAPWRTLSDAWPWVCPVARTLTDSSAPPPGVEVDCEYQYYAVRHPLVVGRHVDHDQTRLEDPDDRDADQGSEEVAHSSGDGDSSEYAGADGVEWIHVAGRGLGGTEPRRQEAATEGSQGADYDEHKYADPVDVDARKPGRLGVASDAVDIAAEDRKAEDQVEDHIQENQDEDGKRHTENMGRSEKAELGRVDPYGKAPARQEGPSLEDGHHPERSDQGVHLGLGDEEAVQQSDEGADGYAKDEDEGIHAVGPGQLCHDNAAEARYGSDREIEGTGQEGEALADAHNTYHRDREADRGKIARVEEVGGQETEDSHQANQDQQHPDLIEDLREHGLRVLHRFDHR